MMAFFFGATLLLLLAAGILLLQRSGTPRAADQVDANLRWYRQRQSELQGQDEQLLDDARLRLLEDAAKDADAMPSPAPGSRRPALIVVSAVLLLSIAIYSQTGALEDVLIYEELSTLTPEDSDATRASLLGRIEARSRAREDNLQYLGLLGQLYMAARDFGAASESFARLSEQVPEDAQALAMTAQARFLAADRQLDRDTQLLAEQSLAIDPQQRTALSLLGMAEFEKGAYATAINYWERLQMQEAPGSDGYTMLAQAIRVARERGGLEAGGGSAAPVPAAGGQAPGAELPGISVALRLPAELTADPQAVVFVFARRADAAGGMPVAVRRLQASELPLTLRLSDSDAMAGQRLSEAGEVLVSAQISANGQPGMANALYSGVAGPVSAGGAGAAVSIELRDPAQRG